MNFHNIIIGASFNPEHWIVYDSKISPIKYIDYIYDELKIRDIRLSIRWENVFDNGNFSFEYYEEFFDYCFSKDFRITLNLGPIKTMRWPEETIPSDVSYLVRNRDNISLNHPISEIAINYLEDLCEFISSKYRSSLDKVVAVQGDNELFNRFGQYKLKIENDFETKINSILTKFFPDKKILINSNGRNDLDQIFKLIQNSDKSRFIIGINYYYKVPTQYKIPFLKNLDGITLSKPWSMSINKLKDLCNRENIDLEISEFQGEPWGDKITSPGNNFSEFKEKLLRCKSFRPTKQERILIRYWGIEDLVWKFLSNQETDGHKKIKELIQNINKNNLDN